MSANRNPSPMMVRPRVADRGGFTLIEVLVAFVVMATLLSVVFRGVVGVRAGSLSFDDHVRRDIVARAVLNDVLSKRDLANGTYSGKRDGLRWTLVAKRLDLAAQMPPPAEATEQKPETEPSGATLTADKQGVGRKDKKPKWVTQRLMISVQSTGRPLEIEAIRLVKAE